MSNFRVIAEPVAPGEPPYFRIEDVLSNPPVHGVSPFLQHGRNNEALLHAGSIADLKAKLLAMAAACDQPALRLRVTQELVETTWK